MEWEILLFDPRESQITNLPLCLRMVCDTESSAEQNALELPVARLSGLVFELLRCNLAWAVTAGRAARESILVCFSVLILMQESVRFVIGMRIR